MGQAPTSQPVGRESALAGVVLCGGRSLRMGQAKAWLEFQGEPLLVRVVRSIASVCSPIVIVAAESQALPVLPSDVRVARDRRPDLGPIEGFCVGMATLAGVADRSFDAALVVSCDAPFVSREVVRWLADRLRPGDDAVVVDDGRRIHPLLGVYRLATVAAGETILAAPRPRMIDLCDALVTRRVSADELRAVDPDLRSLVNVNDPDDLRRASRLNVEPPTA